MDSNIDTIREALKMGRDFFNGFNCTCDPEVGLTCEPCARGMEMHRALAALSTIEAEAIRREWISVNDRLPRDEGQYLVLCRNGYFIAVWNPEAFCWDDADGDDYWKDPIGYFTHWMNLPDMPPLSAEPAQDDGKPEGEESRDERLATKQLLGAGCHDECGGLPEEDR